VISYTPYAVAVSSEWSVIGQEVMPWVRAAMAMLVAVMAFGLCVGYAPARRWLILAVGCLLVAVVVQRVLVMLEALPMAGSPWAGRGSWLSNGSFALVLQHGIEAAQVALIPLLAIAILTRPAVAAALRESASDLPRGMQTLALAALVGGAIGFIVRPASIVARLAVSGYFSGMVARQYGLNVELLDGLLGAWFVLTRAVLWGCCLAMIAGGAAVFIRRPWAPRVLVRQAQFGVVINVVDLVLTLVMVMTMGAGAVALLLPVLSLGLDGWILGSLGRRMHMLGMEWAAQDRSSAETGHALAADPASSSV
jgi:hypothetical protein